MHLGALALLVAPSIVATRTATPPKIDGHLDDPGWQASVVDDHFTQRYPGEGQPPTQRTELRIVYDDDAIYFGVRCWDSDAKNIVARLTRRDRVPEADAVIVRIDSRHDHDTAYVFRLHASGVQFDNFFSQDGERGSPDWDAVWEGEVSIDAAGWTAEYKIPLSVLRFAGLPEETWGLQVVRFVSRTQEQMVWSYWPSELRGEVSRYGTITGLVGLHPHRTFELRPFVLAGVTRHADPAPGDDEFDFTPRVGVDAKIGVTSDLSLDLSVLPDFGQVEADEVVLNLTRFETFFPEKRPFFLEGVELLTTPIQLFYSRRVGATGGADGRLWGAAKLTGKIGPLGVSALAGLDGAGDPARAVGVARLRLGLGGPSYVGAMATFATRTGLGDPALPDADHDAYAQSVDGTLQGASGEWRGTAQLVLSERVGGGTTLAPDGTPRPAGEVGVGVRATVNHHTDHTYQEAFYALYSPSLELNDLGFQTDFDQHIGSLLAGVYDNRPGKVFQDIWSDILQVGAVDLHGVGTANRTQLAFGGTLLGLWAVNASGRIEWPGTWDTLEVGDGARFQRLARVAGSATVSTDPRSAVFASLSVAGGHVVADDAWNAEVSASINLRLSQLELGLGPAASWDAGALRFVSAGGGQYQFADLSARSLSLIVRATYAFTTRLSLQTFAQIFQGRGDYHHFGTIAAEGLGTYLSRDGFVPGPAPGEDPDFDDTTLNLNVVLRWEPLPGSNAYLVYVHDDDDDSVIVKFVYYFG